ncbi:MAG: hypothetical protein WD648_05270 [Planctomycetaceae bacterium]
MLNRLEVDQAVFYALVVRGWQLLAGPITMLLIASYFTADVQGYYYAFASLLGLQAFVELGLEGVIVYIASHERAKLHVDEGGTIVGDPQALSRLVSLGHFAFGFFAVAAVLFTVGVGTTGWFFFAQKPAEVSWIAPWCVLAILTGCSIALIPFAALLRGCHRMATVNRFLSAQAIAGNLVIWACIPLGANLWSAVAVAAVKLFWEAALVVRFRRFFDPFRRRPAAEIMQWRDEIWPLQWRMGIQGVLSALAASLMTLVIFHYHGPAAAGRMGMTWNACLMALQYSAIAWVWTRAPQFGMLVSRRDFGELDRVFNRVTAVSLALLAAAGALFVGGVWLLDAMAYGDGWTDRLPDVVRRLAALLAPRLLPPLPTLLLTAGVVLTHIPISLTIYLRAHKRDPLIALSVFSSAAIASLVWFLGSRIGALGAAAGYLAIIALVSVPGSIVVFLRCRREWH